MMTTRTLTALALTVAAFAFTAPTVKADNLKDIFQKVGRLQVEFQGASRHQRHVDFGHHRPPTRCYPRPDCPDVFPPPPVHHCLYCVYYLDCHHHWQLYRCFHQRCDADSAARQLRFQGYRTYVKVKHLGGGIGGGGGGFPAGPGFPGGFDPFLKR